MIWWRDRPRDLFLWFLASDLSGARIPGTIMAHTHAEFARRKLVTPEQFIKTGWDGLVEGTENVPRGFSVHMFRTAADRAIARPVVPDESGSAERGCGLIAGEAAGFAV